MNAVIFDLDGTIADTLAYSVDVIHSLTQRSKHPMSKQEVASHLRTKTLRQIIKEFDLNWFHLLILVWKIRSRMKERIDDADLLVSEKTLRLLSQQYELVLLTSNTRSAVQRFLDRHGIDAFSQVHTKSSLFGKDKHLRKILRKNGWDADQAVYVGDEVRDFEACEKAGVRMIGVSWGYNSKELLEKHGVQVIDEQEDLLGRLAIHQ